MKSGGLDWSGFSNHTARIGSLTAPKSGASERQQPRPQVGAGASRGKGLSDTEDTDTDTERVWAEFRTFSGPRGPGAKATCASDSWGCFSVRCKRCPVGSPAGTVRLRGGVQ